jgi:hypothetical protein
MKMSFVGVVVIALACSVSSGQQQPEKSLGPTITDAFVHDTVTSLQSLIQKKYFDTSAIPRIEEALVAAEQRGAYAKSKDIGDLVEKLNDTLDQASHDKHLYVGMSELPGATPIQPMLSRAERARMENFGIRQAEVLDGDVGYLKITAFYRANEGAEVLVPRNIHNFG